MFNPDTPTDSINALSELSNRPEPANRVETQSEMAKLSLEFRTLKRTLDSDNNALEYFNQNPNEAKIVLESLTRSIDTMNTHSEIVGNLRPKVWSSIFNPNNTQTDSDPSEIEYSASCRDILEFLKFISTYETPLLPNGAEYKKAPLFNFYITNPNQVTALFDSLAKLSTNPQSQPFLRQDALILLNRFYQSSSRSLLGEDKSFFNQMLKKESNENSEALFRVFDGFTNTVSQIGHAEIIFNFFESNINFFKKGMTENSSEFFNSIQAHTKRIIKSFRAVSTAIKQRKIYNAFDAIKEIPIDQTTKLQLDSTRDNVIIYPAHEVSSVYRFICRALDNKALREFLEGIKLSKIEEA